MSDHLPECPFPHESGWTQCICPELRAAEQRVVRELALDAVTDANQSYNKGYDDALGKAREAVAASGCPCGHDTNDALAAIAALKGI